MHKLYMVVGVPLRASPREATQGALVAAYAIDDTLAQSIKQATTTDVVFFGLDTLDRPYVVGSTLPKQEIAAAVLADTVAVRALGLPAQLFTDASCEPPSILKGAR